ncbi:polysaccharide deacetylase family protein [Streptomyces sp. NBC_00572]|uniref:polysaccharide deacetylase family protein n=1 Tax=Streptomyces sp. NBC_00572 TaxID=2903664 RepID=UPI00225C0946|nr:polysaccharide deacetylase family protein [Streptomyces sp. NBC_00572]MCX4982889.1 polysaccharide deacetylase family protein [Streptomyces sp. NBC_00572]
MAKGVHGSTRVLGAVLVVATLASAATACSDGAEPDRGAPAPAAGQQAPGLGQGQSAARALDAYVARVHKQRTARVLAAKKWGLAKPPLEAPAPPAAKPKITTRKGFETDGEGLPPVFTTVPTKQKVVFLTIDDGAEKDPELLRMMNELRIPYSAFLSDYVVKDDYGYFARMQKSQESGVSLHNHTLNHRYLPGLSYKQQKREICGMQDVIEKRFGKRPPLFRPPYGNYNEDTLRAAKSCGVKAVPLWASEAFPDHMEWREWDRDLHPGDIVLTHFRGKRDWKGSMPDMIRRVMNVITAKGYAVAKLEDYV